MSYRLNDIGRGEYLRTSAARQILGAMAIAFTGAPAAAVLVLVVLKTAHDLGRHLAAHRESSIPTASVVAASDRGA